MVELNEQQQQALDAEGIPLRVVDPRTKETYVLVRADVYDGMRRVVDGFTRSAGWDDPALDKYEKYRKKA